MSESTSRQSISQQVFVSRGAADPNGRPRRVEQLIVPLDGAAFAQRAVTPALRLAERLGAAVTVVTVSRSGFEDDGNAVLASSAHLWAEATATVDRQILVGDDAGLAIAEYAQQAPGSIVCLSSHGRRWPVSAVIGSTAALVVAGSDRPVIVVGPGLSDRWGPDGPLLVGVDTQPGGEAMMPAALGWAHRLGTSMELVIVAEPAPPASSPGPGAAGRRVGPDDYIGYLVGALSGGSIDVTGRVIWDPRGAGPGLATWLRERPAGIVAISSHSRAHRGEEPLGHDAQRIIHDSPIPVLVVPLPPR